jgi:gliding motility-associated-like protein
MNKLSGYSNFIFSFSLSVLKKAIPFTFYLLIGLPEIVFAQNEANNWYFGRNAGITFNSGSPVAVTNGQLNTYEGCATISNSKGRLLFYTDGRSVWDSTHTLTPNGNQTLKGDNSSTQSAIIVPRPDSVGYYYIFTAAELAGSDGLCYSEFSMSFNSGKGDVISSKKNIQLFKSSCEKITAVKHANGRDYWILAHHFGTDTIYSYLITPAGISSNVVKSNTGFTIPNANGEHTLGYLKASPNGSKIAYATYHLDSLALGDFNSSTGVVSNVLTTYLKTGYGVEFSAGSKYLYAIEFIRPNTVVQFNANSTTRSALKASKVILDNTSYPTALQLGPDGKIYLNELLGQYLNVIHAPDSAGKACRYRKNYVSLAGNVAYYGLPSFIQSIFLRKNKIDFTGKCSHDSIHVWPLETNWLDSVKWDFGDPASGFANSSKSIKNAYHVYNKPGVYQVKLISYFKNTNDTSVIQIAIHNTKPFIGHDTTFCNAFNTALKPQKNYLRYKWSTGDTVNKITVNKKGTYILKVTDSSMCVASDTIIIENPFVAALFTISDTAQCKNNNSFQLRNKSIFKEDSLKSVIWKLSDNTSYTDSVFIKSFNTADSFTIKLIVGSNGCKDSLSKKVVVHPNAGIGFSVNKSIQCFNGHDFIFQDTSNVLNGSINSYRWDLGDGDTAITKNIPSKIYSVDSTYKITLITTTDKGCKDTLSKIVTVYPDPKADFSINQPTQCYKYNRYDFTNLSSIKTENKIDNFWNFGDSKMDTTKDVSQKKYATSDSFAVQLLVISNNGCRDSLIKKVYVNPNTNVDFSINENPQCFNGHDFVFTNISNLSSGSISSYDWKLGDGNTATTKDISSKKYSKDSAYTVSIITTTDKGCKDTFSKIVVLNPSPQAGFSINKTTQCFKRNLFDYTNTSVIGNGSIATYVWTLGDGDNRISKDVIAKHYNTMDSFKVDLLLISDNGCRDSISKWVKIMEMNAEFDISIDSTSCPIYTFSNTTKNYKSVKWNMGDPGLNEEKNTRYEPEFNHQFSQFGTFTACLFTENLNGCLDTICKTISVDITKKLKIPNVFTPGNNDNLNDAFDIETAGMEEYHLEIYNRWGQKIFETDVDGIRDDGNNWRGKPNTTANLYPDGTYFYILNYRFKCEDTAKEAHGIITLIGETD